MAKILFLSIFAIILCVYPLYTSAQASVFSYVEQNNDNGRPPRVLTARKFDDGTVVARIVRDVEGTPTCRYEMLSLRFIKPDGTVDEKDFNLNDLQVQQFNYCIPEGDLDYQLIRKDQILVTYYASIEGGIFEQWGVIINLDGKELSRESLGITVRPNSKLQLNTDRTKGFLMLASTYSTDGSDLIYTSWVQYKIEENGAFTKLTEGSLTIDFFLSPTATVMSTVGEGYAIAYAVMNNNYVADNPLLSQGTLYALTIGYNQTTVSPLLLYQTPLPNLSFRALFCDISFAGVGQVCTLTVSQVGTGGVTSNFYVKVNFLSSGSVTSSKVISRLIPDDDPSFIWRVDSLPFGGFLFTNVTNTNPNNIWGYLFGEEETTPAPWGLSNPEPINLSGVFQILPNNTLLVFQEGTDDNSWQYESIVLPRFDGKEDTGYSNVNVFSTSPFISESIYENTTTSVLITFYSSVELSEGNLIIYQMGDKPSLRQKIPGFDCTLVPDSNDTTVNVTVLISTFSVPNGNYFIMMENNFVRDKAYKEPLLGIRENVWWFTTNEEIIELTPSKSGLFRLSVDGTSYYDSLDKKGRQDFFSKLRDELAVAVPVNPLRFITIEKAQLDRSVNEKQYLISIGVKDNKDKNDINVASIIDYIDTMVRKKEQTQIGMGEVTKYLDETYGFNRILNIWERYRTILIVLFFIIIFLLGSFLSAHIKTKRDQKENDTKKDIKNIAILQLGLIIFDLIVDILFVSNSSKDFPELYIPSVVFLTLPIAINTTLAFYIITQENSLNQKFYQWFIKNGKIASVFTVLAGADIEALDILHSNLLGVELFGAPFSDRAKRIINQGGYANIFTEDIPQVIIQIIYYRKAVYYGLVPLLTFISSVLTLAINFATILYETFISKKPETPIRTPSSNPSTS